MDQTGRHAEDVRAFWNKRAGLGQWAGTRDVIVKEIEMRAIAGYVQDGMDILEIGCGNGITAIEIARRFEVDVLGIDNAEEMVDAAKKLMTGQELRGRLAFEVGDIQEVSVIGRRFDMIYTERVIINLPDWQTQRQAITNICGLLEEGGLFVMCENSQNGLDRINSLRREIGLESITTPWHNRYLLDTELSQLDIPGIRLERVNFYSSTYYFLSRIINAWIASNEGKEPDYEAPINQLALRLPAVVGDFGQGRIWLWRRRMS